MVFYIDDITVFSSDLETHEQDLRNCLQLLADAGLKLNAKKCNLFQNRIKVLGFVVSNEGISVDHDKLAKIDSLSFPKTIDEARSVMGFLNFFSRFVPGFSGIAIPINSLFKKRAKFEWGETQGKALRNLKELLEKNASIAYPNMTRPFEVYCDASGTALGAVLTQGGKLIFCASRSLAVGERNYSTTERDCLAIVYALKEFRCYLLLLIV